MTDIEVRLRELEARIVTLENLLRQLNEEAQRIKEQFLRGLASR